MHRHQEWVGVKRSLRGNDPVCDRVERIECRFSAGLKERNDPTQHKQQTKDHSGYEYPRLDWGASIGVGQVMAAVNAVHGIFIDPPVAVGAPFHIILGIRFVFAVFPPGIFFVHVCPPLRKKPVS